ncbi:MAG: radical SAM protein [Elusimicrobiota bacterium]|jgi:radical SAM superfamily enzyme YgiQ (UPF0313 family)
MRVQGSVESAVSRMGMKENGPRMTYSMANQRVASPRIRVGSGMRRMRSGSIDYREGIKKGMMMPPMGASGLRMQPRNRLKVLLIEPCFDNKGITVPYIPLPIGLVGAYLLTRMPDVDLKIMRLPEAILQYVEKEKPHVVGISNYLWNTNLCTRIARFVRVTTPDTLIVFGGAESTTEQFDRGLFAEKYASADIFIQHEGEEAFAALMERFEGCGRDRRKLRTLVRELGNCFVVDESGRFEAGPQLPRLTKFEENFSPYLAGLFDDLLADGRFEPLLETNRGCPFQCAYCQQGRSYYNRVYFRPLEHVLKEIDYIAKRVNPALGLIMVDSNWGMYPQDEAIARRLRSKQKSVGWPMHMGGSAGKSHPDRVMKVIKTLGGALTITRGVQSMDVNVLKIIKRTNLSSVDKAFQDFMDEQVAEFILPLPGETKETFLDGICRLQDSGAIVRFLIYPGLLLCNSELNDRSMVEKYGIKTMFRQHQNLCGTVRGEFVCETERSVVETASMGVEDVLYCRSYCVLIDTLFRSDPFCELFHYLRMKGIAKSEYTLGLFKSLAKASHGVKKCFDEYRVSFLEERFVTERDALAYMEKYSEDYYLGAKGGDLLKYSNMLWIEQFDGLLDWMFTKLRGMREWDEAAILEIENLERFFRAVYYDRTALVSRKDPEIRRDFDFDILGWSKSKGGAPLAGFKRPVEMSFRQTKLSASAALTAWQSFGFHRTADHAAPIDTVNRLYLGRLRRSARLRRPLGRPVKAARKG